MDHNSKIKVIEQFNDEVNELHPFLKDLLNKFPDIKHVEYTHGNYEYGCDFVLIREDTILMMEKYIGVIVKSKKIHQDDVDLIERQINEAFKLDRIILNGQKKIKIDNVWFITNKNITKNAQEKISGYFKERDISFISSDHLVKYIDKYFPEYWNNMTANISNHIIKIRTIVAEEDKRYTIIPHLDPEFYIEPDIIKWNNDGYTHQKSKSKILEHINIKEAIEKERFIIIEAEMGFGKSKLIRQLIKYYSSPEIYEKKKILVFPLKYSELFLDEKFCPDHLFDIYSLSVDEINKHEKSVLMIDGFDEKEEDIENKFNHINSLENFIQKNKKITILLATRKFNEYLDGKNQNSIIKKYEIRGLTLKKIIMFLEQLCKQLNLKDRIIEDIKNSPLFKELPSSPIAAILLSRLFESNSQDLPANLPELYSMYMELVLGRWDIDKGIESLREFEVVQSVLYEMAYYFIDNQCDYMTQLEYKEIIDNYLKLRNIPIFYDRIDDILIKRSGVLLRNERQGIIIYSHRSFIEFMYAKGKSINNNLKVTNKIFNLSWQNIYYFYVGIKKDCIDYLNEIIKIEPVNEGEKMLRLVNLSNIFLAAHTTPYSFFKDNLYIVFTDAARLYVDDVLKEKKSIFAKFPQLIALWWIQLVIKECYAFNFFKDALEETALIIDDMNIDDTNKIYSLFFLGTTGLKLKIYEPFRFLLTKYRDRLPDDISVGIENEISINKIKDESVLKLKKWLDRKLAKTNRNIFKEISETPIDHIIETRKP